MKSYTGVEKVMEAEIEMLQAAGVTRKCAAELLLESKEGWYTQTPEGEYLIAVIKGRE